MRALVIGHDEAVTARVAAIITESGLGYGAVDVAPLASAVAGAGRILHELTVLMLPPDAERGPELVGKICNAAHSVLLTVGPTHDAKLVLRVLREGADEYLDQGDLDAELKTSLMRRQAKQLSKLSSGWTIGLLSSCGGGGASTLAANLAVLLAKWHGQSALVDLRTEASDQAVLLDLAPTHNMADLCRNVNRLDQNMFRQSLVRHRSGVYLLAAPGTFDEVPQVTPQGVRALLGHARTLFPYVVLDLDRSLRPEQLAAVPQMDLLLLVLRLDMTSVRNARQMLDYLRKLGVAEDRVWGVVNRYGQPKELPVRKVEQTLGITVAHRIPDDPAAMNLAGNTGVPVVLERPRARVSKSLVKLAAGVRELQERFRHNGHGVPLVLQ